MKNISGITKNELAASLGMINYRLYGAVILSSLLPTIYMTFRIHFLGALPEDWGYNIASQLTWLNVFYEVIHEALMLPMFFLIGKFINDEKQFNHAASNAVALIGVLYAALSVITIVVARPMIVFMAQKTELIDATVSYIRWEAISAVLAAFVRFFTIVLILRDCAVYLVLVLCIQMAGSVVLDSLFISQLPFSLDVGVNGIAFSNIVVNLLLCTILLILINRKGVSLFGKGFSLDYSWLRSWLKVGGLSGLESFVRNAAFILMVIRLVNVVQEQGVFWVTNNFIWGWLLLPVLALGEVIRRDSAENEAMIYTTAPGYFVITTGIIILWLGSIPFWRGFLSGVMNVGNIDVVLRLSLVSLIFYVIFAYNNVVDSIFYGRGRTDLMLYQSLIVNIFFYGAVFLLYKAEIFLPDLTGIAVMFGLGIAFDSFITFGMYLRFKRQLSTALQESCFIEKN